MNAKWACRFVKCDDESGEHGDEDGLIGKAFLVLLFVYPGKGVIDLPNLVLRICIYKTRSDRTVCWKEQGWAKTSDDKRDEEGEMVEGLSVVVCVFYPMESVVDVGSV